MIIFTSICTNYAHKARVLARSIHEWIPDATFVLCLTEREIPAALSADGCFDRILRSCDMWEGNFDRFIFKHDIVEASTAVKGSCFRCQEAVRSSQETAGCSDEWQKAC